MKEAGRPKEINKKDLIVSGIIRGGIVLLFMGMGLYFVHKEGASKKFMSLLAVTIISSSISGFSTIYDYDVWSTKTKIFVHTICMAITVIPAMIISGWFDLSTPKGYFMILVAFVTSGIIAASLGYFISKYIFKNVPKKQK